MNTSKQSWAKVAKQVLGKKAIQRMGDGSDGQFALVTPCRNQLDFSLWATRESCENSKQWLDGAGCCGGCEPGTHYIVDLKRTTRGGVDSSATVQPDSFAMMHRKEGCRERAPLHR